MNLLLDEMLSRKSVSALGPEGLLVYAAFDVGLGGKSDLEVWRWALDRGERLHLPVRWPRQRVQAQLPLVQLL